MLASSLNSSKPSWVVVRRHFGMLNLLDNLVSTTIDAVLVVRYAGLASPWQYRYGSMYGRLMVA